MKEALFLKKNATQWQKLEELIKNNSGTTDEIAKGFVQLTDDLAFAKTFYPKSNTTAYLNGLTVLFHQKIYKNKKEDKKRFGQFWQQEMPLLLYQYRNEILFSLIVFVLCSFMGALSAQYDDTFIRLILGDDYVNTTLHNIEKKDPFAIYKETNPLSMFLMIGFNNIKVSFTAFVLGITAGIGTGWLLFSNGLMFGSFWQFFISKGLGSKFVLAVFIHGTLELWSIVVAGAAGFILAKSWLIPGTLPRNHSLLVGGKHALKIVIGLVPMFIVAAFLESFVTRNTNMPLILNVGILTASAVFIVYYFAIYPRKVYQNHGK